MSSDIMDKINDLKADPLSYNTSDVSFYVADWIDNQGVGNLFQSSKALIYSALDFINVGKASGFLTVEEAALNWYVYTLCSSKSFIIYHNITNSADWNSSALNLKFKSWISDGMFTYSDLSSFTHFGVACSCESNS